MQWRRMTVLKCSTRSDNGLYLGIPLYLYWMLPVEFSGLNLMIKSSWTAMGVAGGHSMWGVLAEVFRGVAGSSWRETYSGNHAAWLLEPRELAQLHAIAKESVVYIYYPEHSHRRTHCAGIQQREASTAGRAPMNKHQFEVEGAKRPYVRPRPTGKSKKYLKTLLFDRATRRNRKDPYEEKRYWSADIDAVTRYWKQCGSWMAQYKGYVEPYTFNFKKLLKALYHKEGAVQSEVDFFLENCAKKWQTREGTIKSSDNGHLRLDIWRSTSRWQRTFERLRERGERFTCFT